MSPQTYPLWSGKLTTTTYHSNRADKSKRAAELRKQTREAALTQARILAQKDTWNSLLSSVHCSVIKQFANDVKQHTAMAHLSLAEAQGTAALDCSEIGTQSVTKSSSPQDQRRVERSYRATMLHHIFTAVCSAMKLPEYIGPRCFKAKFLDSFFNELNDQNNPGCMDTIRYLNYIDLAYDEIHKILKYQAACRANLQITAMLKIGIAEDPRDALPKVALRFSEQQQLLYFTLSEAAQRDFAEERLSRHKLLGQIFRYTLQTTFLARILGDKRTQTLSDAFAHAIGVCHTSGDEYKIYLTYINEARKQCRIVQEKSHGQQTALEGMHDTCIGVYPAHHHG